MDPLQYALHSGRIGGATQLAAQGATNVQIQRAGRWKSLAFMVYVRAGGEGADFVSQALTQHTVSRVYKGGVQGGKQVGLAQWGTCRDQFPFYRELSQKRKLGVSPKCYSLFCGKRSF